MTLLIKVIRKGASQPQQIELQPHEEVVFGREHRGLKLEDDPRLSRRHFQVQYNGREMVITHLSQTNPTLIAQDDETEFKEIKRYLMLTSNCRIIAGSHRFQLEMFPAPVVEEDSFYNLPAAMAGITTGMASSIPVERRSDWDQSLADQDWQSSASHLGELPSLEDLSELPATRESLPQPNTRVEQPTLKAPPTEPSKRRESETIKLPSAPTPSKSRQKTRAEKSALQAPVPSSARGNAATQPASPPQPRFSFDDDDGADNEFDSESSQPIFSPPSRLPAKSASKSGSKTESKSSSKSNSQTNSKSNSKSNTGKPVFPIEDDFYD